MSVVREAVRLILITVALCGIAIALGAAWLVDRAYEAMNA
jgi:hypothetical protein